MTVQCHQHEVQSMEPPRLIPGQQLLRETLSQHDLLICLLDFAELVKLNGQLPGPLPLQFSPMRHMKPQHTGSLILTNLSASQVFLGKCTCTTLHSCQAMRTHTHTLSLLFHRCFLHMPSTDGQHLGKSLWPTSSSYLFRALFKNTKAKICQVNFWHIAKVAYGLSSGTKLPSRPRILHLGASNLSAAFNSPLSSP